MRVLVISPLPLLPQSHGARVRTYRLAAGLARAGAEVDVLFPWTPGRPVRPARADGMTLHPQRFALNALPRLVSERLVPWQVLLGLQPFAPGPRRRLRAFDGYDIAQFEMCANARWMGRAPRGAKVVYSAHNVELDFCAGLRGPSRWWGGVLSAVKALEGRAVRASDLVVGTTAEDEPRLTELYGPPRRFDVVPQGHPTATLNGAREEVRMRTRSALGLDSAERAVLFVGGPGHHNRRAVRFLEHELLPRLGERARLVLAGECAPRSGPRPRATIRLGFVDDLEPLLAAADVAVNPIASAAGQSLKVAEYLGAGLPVVATRAGARGSQAASRGVRIAELEDFPAAVAAAAEEGRSPLAEPALATWEDLGLRLHRAYEELLRS